MQANEGLYLCSHVPSISVGLIPKYPLTFVIAWEVLPLTLRCMQFRLIYSPWRKEFETHISRARKQLLIAAPYYTDAVIRNILKQSRKQVEKRFLLTLSEHEVKAGVQSPHAIKTLRAAPSCEVRFIRKPTVHAKFIVVDRKSAIVTSSNLTGKGLDSNIEMGIQFYDPNTAEELANRFDSLWSHGKEITEELLDTFASFTTFSKRLREGKAFGGTVLTSQPKQSNDMDMDKLGWIMIHSTSHYPYKNYETPETELKGRSASGERPVKWRWNRGGRGPMKADGCQYTVLLAFKGKVFGKAKAKITSVKKESAERGHPFAFMLSNFEKLKEVPLRALVSGRHRDLIKLNKRILERHESLLR